MKERILLFIPAYNCEKQIPRVLAKLDEKVMKYITDIIIVNNQSTDDTEKVVLGFMEEHKNLPIRLLRNDENYGLGGSQKMSFHYAIEGGYDYVLMLHGDDQGDIHDFIPMFEKGIHRHHDCVLGARFMKGSKLVGYSRFRTFGNIIYDFIFASVIRQRVFDLGSGLNLYKVSMLKDLFFEKFPDNLMFNYAMILASHYYKHDVIFYPVSWREEDQVSNEKMMNQAVLVLKMAFEYFRNNETIKGEYRETLHEVYSSRKVG